MESRFMARQFSGKVTNANRSAIYENFLLFVSSDDESEIDDFVRVFILFLFNCITFPADNYATPSFIFPYLDDLTTFFKFAWGDAAFCFLYRKICHLGSKTYLDGCTSGLLAWVYERVSILGVRHEILVFPRLLRWEKSKIPLKAADAESVLKDIYSTKVLLIYPFGEDEKLLDIKVLKLEEGTSDARKYEKIAKKQIDEINLLKNEIKLLKKLEGGNVRHGTKKEEVEVEKDGNIEEDMEDVNLNNKKVNVELGQDVVVNFDDVADVMVHNVLELAKENNEMVGADFGNVSDDESAAGTDSNMLVQNNVNGSEEENYVLRV